MNKLKIILTVGIATALTLSCSNGNEDDLSSSSGRNDSSSSNGNGGDGSGSFEDIRVYELVSKTADQFTYKEVYSRDKCTEGGVLVQKTYNDEYTQNYSISNNTMTWQKKWSSDGDTLNFKGASNDFIGTWTRTKDKVASCELYTNNYDGDSWSRYECKEGYDIVKAVFTETAVSITRAICLADEIAEGTESTYYGGWIWKVVDCNTLELHKGTDKAIMRIDDVKYEDVSYSYKGKTCRYSEPSKSQKETACKKAWDEHQNESDWDDYYDHILEKDFNDCMEKNMPQDWYEYKSKG